MNCSQAQDKILLADSGELDARDSAELDKHLAACLDCAAYRSDLEILTAQARMSLPSGSPGPAALERIRGAAARRKSRRIIAFPARVAVLSACAAGLLVAAGVFLLPRPNSRSERIAHVHNIIALISEPDMAQPHRNMESDNEQKLRSLARQLLAVEGFAPEEMTEQEASLWDLLGRSGVIQSDRRA